MTDTVDLASLLTSAEGISALHNGSSMFGVRVFALESKINNCVDYGVTTVSDWEPEYSAPKGYEELHVVKSVVMDQIITITNEAYDPLPVMISDIKILPRDTVGRPCFTFAVPDANEGDSPVKGMVIKSGHSTRLNLRCTIPVGFEGFLGRYEE